MTIDPNKPALVGVNDMQANMDRAERILADWAATVNKAAGLPSPADDGASDEDVAPEPGWHRRQRADDKADDADRKDDDRRIGRK